MSGPAPQAVAPGQAAYEGMCRRALADDGPRGRSEGWEALEPWQRDRWDAAAAAANRAGLPRVLAEAARYKAERDAARGGGELAELDAAYKKLEAQCEVHWLERQSAEAHRDRYRQALERIAMGVGIMSQAQASVIAARALGSSDDPIADAVASGRDRYRAALERVLRILRGEGTEVMDDAELAAVIARALGEDGQSLSIQPQRQEQP